MRRVSEHGNETIKCDSMRVNILYTLYDNSKSICMYMYISCAFSIIKLDVIEQAARAQTRRAESRSCSMSRHAPLRFPVELFEQYHD